MKKLYIATIASALLAMTISTNMTYADATGVVKQRQDAMSAIGDANKPMADMARGRADFDLDTVTQNAAIIAEHSTDTLLEFFVEGTDGGDSDAKPEIWQDWDKFSGIMGELNQASINLSQISSEEEFAGAFKAMSSTCGSCHKEFRIKR